MLHAAFRKNRIGKRKGCKSIQFSKKKKKSKGTFVDTADSHEQAALKIGNNMTFRNSTNSLKKGKKKEKNWIYHWD